MIDVVMLVVGAAGFVYILSSARRLADRPRRGTELRPSYRAWLALSLLPLILCAGALVNLLD